MNNSNICNQEGFLIGPKNRGERIKQLGKKIKWGRREGKRKEREGKEGEGNKMKNEMVGKEIKLVATLYRPLLTTNINVIGIFQRKHFDDRNLLVLHIHKQRKLLFTEN